MKSLFLRLALVGLVAAGGARLSAQSLVNLSAMAQAGGGTPLSLGFVVSGGNKTVLIRAVGPTLQTTFGLTGVLPHPILNVYPQGVSTAVASNNTWGGTAALTTAFTQVGAFALPPTSLDAALTVTLPPGIYSATATSATAATGLCIIEIYDVSGAGSQLINLSTLLPVGGSAPTFGFVISPGPGARELIVRAVGPSLAQIPGVPGPLLSDPNLAVVNAATGQSVAANDDWGSAGTASLNLAFSEAGAFPLLAGSKDSALVANFSPGRYSIVATGNNGATGTALVEIYDITPAGSNSVAVTASGSSGSTPGSFSISRSGDLTLPLTVAYSVAGSAVPGTDYAALPGVVTIPAGSVTAPIPLTLYPTTNSNPSVSVTMALQPGTGYVTGSPTAATVSFTPVTATLYTTVLRAASGGSTASGTASILYSASSPVALVSMNISNLSSPEVISHLELGTPGQNPAYVLALPTGQVSGQVWTFAPTGPYASSDLIAALQSGQIFAEVDTANYPSGELTGGFIRSTGSQTFTAPAAPPALPASALGPSTDATNAVRLLTQATFGPVTADVTAVMNQGVSAWISAQMTLPATSHLAAVRADATAFPNPQAQNIANYFFTQTVNQQAAWWKIALTAPDQLRQRVAFALSEILVVSDQGAGLIHAQEGLAKYYDTLAADAFGNFRTLIEDVTLSPVMGTYLSSLRNAAGNAALGTSADENYAREIQQLFTVGLVALQPDGTLQLDAGGRPIPTYDQTEITSTARVFTGWSFASASNNFYSNPLLGTTYATQLPDTSPWLNPMAAFNAYHDTTAKTILGGVVIPAGGTAQSDLKIELDTLFNHPNTGPFLCKQLIQRLVTSNPSPGYVYRVAQVFANDGTGTRGNLGAVVTAILTDYEARSAAVTADAGYGKLKEPLLRVAALLRAMNVASQNGRYIEFVSGATGNSGLLASPMGVYEQQALHANTVFNFFAPSFVSPGPLAAAGLVAPEFQITDADTTIQTPNALYTFVFNRQAPQPSNLFVLDVAGLAALAGNPSALLDQLSLMYCGNAMTAATRTRITAALNTLAAGGVPAAQLAESALYLTVTSPESAIQR